MKKMLFSSVLGLLALASWAAPSQAWTFGLIPDHCWNWCGGCCGSCTSTITIQPYNAFSPTACGSMCFTGCNPFCYANQGCGPAGYPGCYQGCCPGALNSGYLPAYNGCPTDSSTPTVVTPTAPAPAATSQAQPYTGPVPAPGAYGFAPMVPQSVMPNAGQQFYPAGYGR